MKFWKWLKSLFKKEAPSVEVIKPQEPLPEIPTREEVDNFPPKKEIANFEFVDSSHHHPDFDPVAYKKMFKPGMALLSNKCTQGVNFIDKTHAQRKKLCIEHDINYSGYHFYQCHMSPIAQAEHYVKVHGPFDKDFPPQLDYETEEGVQTEKDLINDKEDFLKCLQRVEELTGMVPWIYINWGAASRIKFDKRFAKYPVWFARYNSYLGPIPSPWTEESVGAWQYTDEGKFPGFKGGNDVNIYYGKNNVLGLEG